VDLETGVRRTREELRGKEMSLSSKNVKTFPRKFAKTLCGLVGVFENTSKEKLYWLLIPKHCT
jgi:hypothetical protein